MKTAGRENQKRYRTSVATRDRGTEGESNPAQWGGLDGKKKSGRKRSVFFLTPFIKLIGHNRLGASFAVSISLLFRYCGVRIAG
jgi:hypothetical protein